MQDIGHQETDKLLSQLEREIKEVYKQAYKSAKKTADEYMIKFQADDLKKRKKLRNREITVRDYKAWRKSHLLTGQRYQDMANALAKDMTNANQIAASIINGYLPEVYAINGNYAAYQIENITRVNTGFMLYSRETVERLIRDKPNLLPMTASVNIPIDLRWNKQKINSAIMQGILTGESIPKIAKRLADVTDMNHVSAVRNARTMVTSAENGGRVDSYKRAERMGIRLKQEWVAVLDGRTRHSHRQLDGEKVKVGDKFSNGCRFPADPQGVAHEIYNCRCTLVISLDGIDDSDAERYSKLGDMTYDEWKRSKPKYPKKQVKNK